MSNSQSRAGGPSSGQTRSSSTEYRTPVSFYVMMGGIVVGLLMALIGLFFI